MKGIPQGSYNREFRQEAVKLAVEDMESFWGIIKAGTDQSPPLSYQAGSN